MLDIGLHILTVIFFFILTKIDAKIQHNGTNVPLSYFGSINTDHGRTSYKRRYIGQKESPYVLGYNESFRRAIRSGDWHWTYANTDEWGEHIPDCGGKSQSPINLDLRIMSRLNLKKKFRWKNYNKKPTDMKITNNGHTIQISGTWNKKEIPHLAGGTLAGDYVFEQLHFHWGEKDDVGSEHTINKYSFPLEMHMVHYKKKYGSIKKALECNDGLAVVGIFFEISRIDNPGISTVLKDLKLIKPGETEACITPFALKSFHLNFPNEYVSYSGSLTTPPCSESVIWIIPAIPRFISEHQINMFRSVKLGHGDVHNFRPTLALNNRPIYYISD